jgi:hypothetical protein
MGFWRELFKRLMGEKSEWDGPVCTWCEGTGEQIEPSLDPERAWPLGRCWHCDGRGYIRQ